jgi:DnaJ-class molecular chaperone
MIESEDRSIAPAQALPILEILCDECNGDGDPYQPNGEWHYCDKCNGAGYVLTKDGEAILAMIQRRIKHTPGIVSWR